LDFFKKNKKNIATGALAVALTQGANMYVSQTKEKQEIINITQSADFQKAMSIAITAEINKEGGLKSRAEATDNRLKVGSEKMNKLESVDREDYKELNGKISKNRDDGIERYISNLKDTYKSEIDNLKIIHENDLKACDRQVNMYRDLLKLKK